MMSRMAIAALLFSILSSPLPAQDMPGKKAPSVTMQTPATATVTRGKVGSTELQFRVGAGFHINSNKPSADYLIPYNFEVGCANRSGGGQDHISAGPGKQFCIRTR